MKYFYFFFFFSLSRLSSAQHYHRQPSLQRPGRPGGRVEGGGRSAHELVLAVVVVDADPMMTMTFVAWESSVVAG